MRQIAITDYLEVLLPVLVRDGYITKENINYSKAHEQIQEAHKQWIADHPYLPPLIPSGKDPTKEAECSLCHDKEWLSIMHYSEGYSYMELRPCNCMLERTKAEREGRRLEMTGIPEAHRGFEQFNIVQGSEDAFDAASLLGIGKANFALLLIYGTSGNGKTHLTYSALMEAHKRELKVKYITMARLVSDAKMAMFKDIDVLQPYRECDFLAVDEWGLENTTIWTNSLLEDLVDYRYAHQKPMILVTNKNPTKISNDPQQPGLPLTILSRFKDSEIGKIVHNKAPDYRPKKGKEKDGA